VGRAALGLSVRMNIAVTVANLVLGLAAIGVMARTFSFRDGRAASREEQRYEQPA
jgi:hypothetical protein